MIDRPPTADSLPGGARPVAGRLPARAPRERRWWTTRIGLAALLCALGTPAAAGGAARVQDTPAPGPAAADEAGDAWAFLEWQADADDYVLGQVVDLRLRVGLDEAFFATHALPLFRRPMDLPVQIEAPWWDELPGTLALDTAGAPDTAGNPDPAVVSRAAPDSADAFRTLALGDAVVEARRLEARVVDGRRFTVLELRRRLLPRYAGTLTVPAPVLHFAFASTFRDDLVQGRVPEDRHAARVTGRPLALAVRPLPEAGRPAGFTGAVGRFSVQADAQPRELSVGEQLVLTLHIDGEGNLSAFDAPALPPLPGFTNIGRLSDDAGPPRTLRYGLVATDAAVQTLAPLPFAYYDPAAGTYRRLQTAPIPVRVREREQAATGGEAAADGTGHADDATRESASTGTGRVAAAEAEPDPRADDTADERSRLWLLGVSVAVLVALGWATARAWRTVSAPTEPAAGAAGAAALAAFREATRAADADPTQPLVAYLAARLGCSQAEVAGTGLRERLVAAGAPTELASRAAACVRASLAARYGGGTPSHAGTDVRALAEELEVAFGS